MPSVLQSNLKKHNLSTDDLKGLVMSMQRPILVYKHGQHAPNIVVVTELDVKGGKLSASLKLDSNGEVVEVSNISSIHSKDAETELARLYKVGEEEFRNSLRWVEKEKVLHWIAPSSYEPSGMQNNEAPFDIAKVINDFVNPKVEDGNLQDEAKFSFIGELGATVSDDTDGVTTRMDNFQIAQGMEEAKKDAKAIKMATGWERGADGKWRYEMPDAKIKDTTDIGGGHIVKRSEKDMLWNGGKLGEVVDAPELFKAYPQLKDIKLSTDAIMNDMSSNGTYNSDTKTITIHADELKYLNSILNHEIQHAIQYIEGFAVGTNPKSASVRAGTRKSESFRKGQERLAEKVGDKYDMLSPSTQILDGDYFFGNIPKVTEIEKTFSLIFFKHAYKILACEARLSEAELQLYYALLIHHQLIIGASSFLIRLAQDALAYQVIDVADGSILRTVVYLIPFG